MTTSADVRRRLLERYPLGDGWITLAEVTPPGTSRRFDLLAIMGWQSRGHEAMGFEIKVSRSDWLRELAEPAKADPLVRLCSRYWIVAPPGVVEAAELPPAWGLLVVHPEQIRTGRQAPRLDCEPWSDAVWRCILLRCATRMAREPDEVAKALEEGRAQGIEIGRHQVQADAGALADLREAVERAEEALGVPIARWPDLPSLAAAYRLVRQADTAESCLRREAERLDKVAEDMRAAAAGLGAVGKGAA